MDKMSLNKIYIDSIYTPVLKVNYTVENTRVEQITDYDKLTLYGWIDVWFQRGMKESSDELAALFKAQGL